MLGGEVDDFPAMLEQPMSFELVINLKTAGDLNLTIPQARLARADDLMD